VFDPGLSGFSPWKKGFRLVSSENDAPIALSEISSAEGKSAGNTLCIAEHFDTGGRDLCKRAVRRVPGIAAY